MCGLYAITGDLYHCGNAVMSKRSNSDKIYDLSGNVHEFVWDLITDPNLGYSSEAVEDPVNFTTNFNNARQFYKGGAWDSTIFGNSILSTGRENELLGIIGTQKGFRVVRTAK